MAKNTIYSLVVFNIALGVGFFSGMIVTEFGWVKRRSKPKPTLRSVVPLDLLDQVAKRETNAVRGYDSPDVFPFRTH
jgi:hypothetical protein